LTDFVFYFSRWQASVCGGLRVVVQVSAVLWVLEKLTKVEEKSQVALDAVSVCRLSVKVQLRKG
jgi:hypothetical protein